jgi:hypothetical protein
VYSGFVLREAQGRRVHGTFWLKGHLIEGLIRVHALEHGRNVLAATPKP